MSTFENFSLLDICAGTIIEALEFPEARKPAYKLTIDFGSMGIKRSSAQITALYDVGSLVGKQVVAVINFPPRQIAKFISECLVLGIYNSDGDVVLLMPERPVNNGDKIG